MKHAKDIVGENTREFAKRASKFVLPEAEKLGMDVCAMKERMARWVNVVANYERDIAAVKANLKMKNEDKQRLISEMREARDSLREEIFG